MKPTRYHYTEFEIKGCIKTLQQKAPYLHCENMAMAMIIRIRFRFPGVWKRDL